MLAYELSNASLLKLISFLFWSGLYIHSAVSFPDKSPEWSSRSVTLLHGTVGAVVGLVQCGVTNLTTWRLTMKITARHYALMVWSWGYFAFDLLWCILHQETTLMICHHAFALIGITIYMHKDYTGCTFACNLALMEITNPLLQIRWFLKYNECDKTTIFYIVETLYLGMFLFVRGALGSYLLYKILDSDMFDLDEKIISLVFYFVSMAFIYDIMGYVLHRYKAKIGAVRQYLDEIGVLGIH